MTHAWKARTAKVRCPSLTFQSFLGHLDDPGDDHVVDRLQEAIKEYIVDSIPEHIQKKILKDE